MKLVTRKQKLVIRVFLITDCCFLISEREGTDD